MSKLVKWSDYSKIYEDANPGSGIDEIASKKIQKAQIMLVAQAAFFGQLLMNLRLIEDRNLPYKSPGLHQQLPLSTQRSDHR